MMKKGTNWTADECYLAVWIYDLLDKNELTEPRSRLYLSVSEIIGRTPSSVEFKVQNVSAVDPRPITEKPISEKTHYQALLKTVFDWYWLDRDTSRALYDLVILRIKYLKENSRHHP